jgi:hypothetical protein
MTERLDHQEKWLLARLESTRTIKSAVASLYGTLSMIKKTANELLAPHMGMGMMSIMIRCSLTSAGGQMMQPGQMMRPGQMMHQRLHRAGNGSLPVGATYHVHSSATAPLRLSPETIASSTQWAT